METKKGIAGSLVVSLAGVNLVLCEIANAGDVCDEEWLCKPEYHMEMRPTKVPARRPF
jgi:hypothetical protein